MTADQLLFSYGTLQLESVQRSQFGRLLEGRDDVLTGYAVIDIQIRDPAVLDASGIEIHRALIPDPDAPSIAGKVFRLIDALEDLDDVQNVYANYDVSDEVMEKIDA